MAEHYLHNIEDDTLGNENFRTEKFTGKYIQLTLMSIVVGGEIGAEVHPETDQFLRCEAGKGEVWLGDSEETMAKVGEFGPDDALIIPSGTWHNVTNTGDEPLKLYSLYAPPHHPKGTVQKTKAEADAAEAAE